MSMLGGHLDGLHIKEADKVPRRSLVLTQHPKKRARVEESSDEVKVMHPSIETPTLPKDDPFINVVQVNVESEVPASAGISPHTYVPSAPPRNDPVSLIKREEWTAFKSLVDQGVPMHGDVIHALVDVGEVDLLAYARSKGNCKFKTKNVMKYAKKRKLPQEILNELAAKLRGDTFGENIILNHNILTDLSDTPIDEALADWVSALQMDNPMRTFKRLRELNCPWNCAVCEKAIRYGHYEALEYLLQEGCPMGTKLCTLIIERELWTFLPLIVKYGYKLDPKIRFEFARYGQLGGLKATVECGMKMVSEVCVLSALNGHLDCLTFAHEHGAKIDQKVCLGAVQQGHLTCLRYALQQGCTMTKILPTQAVKYNHMHILKYLHEQGCPMDKKTSKMAEDLPVPAAVELDITL